MRPPRGGTVPDGEQAQVNLPDGRSVPRDMVLGCVIRTPPGACGLSPWPPQPLRASCAHVPADPPPQLVPAPNVTVSPGETAVLSCRVLGEAPYNLTWVRDWRVLPASTGRVTQLDDLSLKVSAIVPSDGGRYQCIASNANGATRASVWLLVRGEALPAVAVLPDPHTTQHLPPAPVHPPCAQTSPLAGRVNPPRAF